MRPPKGKFPSETVWLFLLVFLMFMFFLFLLLSPVFFEKKPAEQAQSKVLPWISDSGGPTTSNPLEIVPGEQFQYIEPADTVMFEPIVLDSWIEDLANLDDKTYMICHRCVLQYDGTEKMTLVVLLPEGLRIRGKRHLDRYWEVCNSDFQSDFAGFLQCHDDEWTFHSYHGECRGVIGSVLEKRGDVIFVLYAEGVGSCPIVFDPKTGKFSDM